LDHGDVLPHSEHSARNSVSSARQVANLKTSEVSNKRESTVSTDSGSGLNYLGNSHQTPGRTNFADASRNSQGGPARKSQVAPPPPPESPSKKRLTLASQSLKNDDKSTSAISTKSDTIKSVVKPPGGISDNTFLEAMQYFGAGGSESGAPKHTTVLVRNKDGILVPVDNNKLTTEKSIRARLASGTLVLVWIMTCGELTLDLITTIISFVAISNGAECCDEPVEFGKMPLIVTVPFLFLILLELALLVYCIRLTMFGKTNEASSSEEAGHNALDGDEAAKKRSIWNVLRPKGTKSSKDGTIVIHMINTLVLLNPFFGCFVAWMLLYQTSKTEAFSVLGLEGLSIILHWFSVYLEGHKQTKWSIALHVSPLLPFLVTVTVILVYWRLGGVCYLVEEERFWYDGCQVCADETIPESVTDPNIPDVFAFTFKCADGSKPSLGKYCAFDADSRFCFFNYS
jgi:hypothetical protein